MAQGYGAQRKYFTHEFVVSCSCSWADISFGVWRTSAPSSKGSWRATLIPARLLMPRPRWRVAGPLGREEGRIKGDGNRERRRGRNGEGKGE